MFAPFASPRIGSALASRQHVCDAVRGQRGTRVAHAGRLVGHEALITAEPEQRVGAVQVQANALGELQYRNDFCGVPAGPVVYVIHELISVLNGLGHS
jgi:hypothetical protein